MKPVQNQVVMIQIPAKTQNNCEIEWNAASPQEWESHFHAVRRANLLQSTDYARSAAKRNHQTIRRGIIRINGDKAGLVQVLEAGIANNIIHALLLDRGPLWFEGYGDLQDFRAFLQTFSQTFPKRLGRRIRFIPEIENSAQAKDLLREYGYRTRSRQGYQTIWLDLRPNIEVLRQNLRKKWRNTLKKAENQGLEVVWSNKTEHLAWLMQNYTIDKAARNYDGPSPKTILTLAEEFSRGQNMLLGVALLDAKPIASILLFKHGSGATYQIGYTSDSGREKCAHHLLLWQAVIELKKRHINDFDLGGVNDETAKGVKTFKEGLGGQPYETAGLYH